MNLLLRLLLDSCGELAFDIQHLTHFVAGELLAQRARGAASVAVLRPLGVVVHPVGPADRVVRRLLSVCTGVDSANLLFDSDTDVVERGEEAPLVGQAPVFQRVGDLVAELLVELRLGLPQFSPVAAVLALPGGNRHLQAQAAHQRVVLLHNHFPVRPAQGVTVAVVVDRDDVVVDMLGVGVRDDQGLGVLPVALAEHVAVVIGPPDVVGNSGIELVARERLDQRDRLDASPVLLCCHLCLTHELVDCAAVVRHRGDTVGALALVPPVLRRIRLPEFEVVGHARSAADRAGAGDDTHGRFTPPSMSST